MLGRQDWQTNRMLPGGAQLQPKRIRMGNRHLHLHLHLQLVVALPAVTAWTRQSPSRASNSLTLPQDGGVCEEEARSYFQQLIMAMDYCHCLGIALRDIKVTLDRVLSGTCQWQSAWRLFNERLVRHST